jgi:hypothetical protein
VLRVVAKLAARFESEIVEVPARAVWQVEALYKHPHADAHQQ